MTVTDIDAAKSDSEARAYLDQLVGREVNSAIGAVTDDDMRRRIEENIRREFQARLEGIRQSVVAPR